MPGSSLVVRAYTRLESLIALSDNSRDWKTIKREESSAGTLKRNGFSLSGHANYSKEIEAKDKMPDKSKAVGISSFSLGCSRWRALGISQAATPQFPHYY